MKEETLAAIEAHVGIAPSQIAEMDWDDIDKHIESKINKKLDYDDCADQRVPPRGSVFLMLRRFINPVDIDKRITRMK